MKVGYAQAVITPSLDKTVFLAGFGQNRRAETIHDDLYVRALALQTEGTTLVLTALDLIGFFRHDVYEVIEILKASETFRVLKPEVLIASVHPHHGPDTMGIWGPDMRTRGVDEDYMRGLKDKIVAAILASLADLQPATVKMTSVHVPGLAKNNRNPEILDDELTLAQFIGRDDSPFVSLFNFPCHPEVLWEHNPHITADYVGYLRDEVQHQTGAPCIFFAGDLGGMMTPHVKDHSFAEAELMGKKLAKEGVKALGQVQSTQVKEISLQKKDIQARMTNPLYKLAFLFKTLPDARNQRGEIESEVNLVKIGGLWLAAVPGELLPKLGMQLKAQMKAAGAQVAGVIGLANDELGYILPVEDFEYPLNPFKPGKHYEETNSIGKGIAPAVMDGLSALLK
ncbi:MAG: neutral/alkaline non-lysosomal ceramidase N-terminal domain-containing protein [Chloroflexi bacterium]|nr:neutral/alkaline non-lysosomal ceramidase N-terminal domain-containing protein [Chloroflexota bacterium]